MINRNEFNNNKTNARRCRKKKQQLIEDVKCVPCANCGIQYPHYQMDFHHKCNKKFNLSQSIKAASIKEMKSEIEKCDVLCCICHRNLHHTQERSSQCDIM